MDAASLSFHESRLTDTPPSIERVPSDRSNAPRPLAGRPRAGRSLTLAFAARRRRRPRARRSRRALASQIYSCIRRRADSTRVSTRRARTMNLRIDAAGCDASARLPSVRPMRDRTIDRTTPVSRASRATHGRKLYTPARAFAHDKNAASVVDGVDARSPLGGD